MVLSFVHPHAVRVIRFYTTFALASFVRRFGITAPIVAHPDVGISVSVIVKVNHTVAARSKDRFQSFGWPKDNMPADLTEPELWSLIGESVNLPCITSILGAFVTRKDHPVVESLVANHRNRSSSSHSFSRLDERAVEVAPTLPETKPKKRRCLGAVGPRA